KRLYAFIKHYFNEIGDTNGHTWVDISVLENAVRDNIQECEFLFEKMIDNEKVTKGLLYIEDNKVGLKHCREIELNIFSILQELDRYKTNIKTNLDEGIKEAEEEQGFSFTEEQNEIIKEAVNKNI